MINVINSDGYCIIESPKCNISVFDVTGKLLTQENNKKSIVLSLDIYPSGIYNVILNNGTETEAIKVVL